MRLINLKNLKNQKTKRKKNKNNRILMTQIDFSKDDKKKFLMIMKAKFSQYKNRHREKRRPGMSTLCLSDLTEDSDRL